MVAVEGEGESQMGDRKKNVTEKQTQRKGIGTRPEQKQGEGADQV